MSPDIAKKEPQSADKAQKYREKNIMKQKMCQEAFGNPKRMEKAAEGRRMQPNKTRETQEAPKRSHNRQSGNPASNLAPRSEGALETLNCGRAFSQPRKPTLLRGVRPAQRQPTMLFRVPSIPCFLCFPNSLQRFLRQSSTS